MFRRSPSASPSPSPSPSGTPTSQPVNISTRVRVEGGDGVVIGGFIITGNVPKKIIIRGVGPSLVDSGLTDVIDDPTLQLFGDGGQIAFNDDWRNLQESDIAATMLQPNDDREPAIIATLSPAAYTAIVSGKNGTTGVGLLEIYDLDAPLGSRLANLSTRGSVLTQENVMIGGFILGGTNHATRQSGGARDRTFPGRRRNLQSSLQPDPRVIRRQRPERGIQR